MNVLGPQRSALLVAAILGGSTLTAAQRPVSFPDFSDVAAQTGLALAVRNGVTDADFIIETTGNGAGFFDYDNDGDTDVVLVWGSTLAGYEERGGDRLVSLYENRDAAFVDVTAEARLTAIGWGQGVCAADYNNDGYRDFYVTAYGANTLYENLGGTFRDVTSRAGVAGDQWSTNCAFGDYDRDGDVDLYVANYVAFDPETVPRRGEVTEGCLYMGQPVVCGPRGLEGEPDVLYRNDGDGTFTDVTSEAGINDPGHYGFGVVFRDLNNDMWPDIYVANDSVPNLLFRNEGDGTFQEVGLISGAALAETGREQAGMGVGVGDYDGNQHLDLFVTNFAEDTNTLYRNSGDMFFFDATVGASAAGAAYPNVGWGTGFVDLDNDGWLDIFVSNGHIYPSVNDFGSDARYRQPKEIYRNRGDGTFEEVAGDLAGDPAVPKSARGTAFGDYDNDGDIDVLAVNMSGPPSLYRNEGGNRRHWIGIRLEGVDSNRDGIGARVEVEVGGRTQVREVGSGSSYLSHNDIRAHFGLGEFDQVDRLRVRWPSGTIDEFTSLETDRYVTVREGATELLP